MSRLKRSLAYVAPTAAVLAVLAIGVIVGRWVTLRSPAAWIAEHNSVFSTGEVFADEGRSAATTAYHDPELAKREMDGWSWAVPNAPAPFVGSLPRPGTWLNASIDGRGFRHERPILQPKPSSLVRVFVTGGSTAYGAGAPSRERTIGGYLERLLNDRLASSSGLDYEVIVAANQAWASTHERILIANRLSELEPDLVISLSGNNDVHWARAGRDVLWFRTYADEHWLRFVNRAYLAADDGRLTDVVVVDEDPVDPETVATRLEKNVRLAAHALGLGGARYVFALQPTFNVTSKPLSQQEQRIYDRLNDNVRRYFKDSYERIRDKMSLLDLPNAAFIDLSDAFATVPSGETVFLDSYHFGDRGNELVAEALYEAVLPFLIDARPASLTANRDRGR